MECDDRVDMLSFKTHVQHVWGRLSTSRNVGVFMSPGAGATNTRSGEGDTGRRDLRRNEYLKLNNSEAQGHDATRGNCYGIEQ